MEPRHLPLLPAPLAWLPSESPVWERGAASGVLECVAQADPAHAGACACMWGVCVRSVVCVRTCMRTTHMRAHDAPNRSDGVQICLVCSWGGGAVKER